ncbi:MAG: nucleotidyltransferase family protein [Defluviitaleaceae bacterium]|nr:nucleotidyltransferase family protein [Defluviitaleaceae bacterium]
MNAAGIIVEFNPLHKGHIEHLQETKRLTQREYIIAIMSGNFVQRGEPAICDKWRRTQMALHSGVDIVIELPVPYVVSGADYFARGAVNLLAATGVVDKLCFGSESGELELIKECGQVLAHEPDSYKTALRNGLDKGLSFAAARGAALDAVIGNVPEGLLSKPNNGLGMEYCKALWQTGWPMEAYTSYRKTGGPSATAIRKDIWKSKSISKEMAMSMPNPVLEIMHEAIEAKEIPQLEDFNKIFRYLLYTGDINLGEGLENRFRHFAKEHCGIIALLDAVKTKRYTYTRLQRAVISIILGIKHEDILSYESTGGPAYIRVLGFKRSAAVLLGEITRRASLPVLTSGSAMDQLHGSAASMLSMEFKAGDIYRLAYGGQGGYRSERGMPMIVL